MSDEREWQPNPILVAAEREGHAADVTLRDLFAGLAMNGWFAGNASKNISTLSVSEAAEESYRAADAMLKERAK